MPSQFYKVDSSQSDKVAINRWVEWLKLDRAYVFVSAMRDRSTRKMHAPVNDCMHAFPFFEHGQLIKEGFTLQGQPRLGFTRYPFNIISGFIFALVFTLTLSSPYPIRALGLLVASLSCWTECSKSVTVISARLCCSETLSLSCRALDCKSLRSFDWKAFSNSL